MLSLCLCHICQINNNKTSLVTCLKKILLFTSAFDAPFFYYDGIIVYLCLFVGKFIEVEKYVLFVKYIQCAESVH